MNLATLVALLIPIFPNLVICIHIKEYHPEERDGLLQLRDSMSSSSINLHRNWSGPPCLGNLSRWDGVGCSDWHVIHLVLDGIQLTGSLPPAFLSNITFLTTLSFRNNSIFGPLPNLTNLDHLQHVFLSYNRFTGSIPYDYIQLSNLKSLELQQNYLEGQIPPFDQNSLTNFNVSYNHLEGPIPSTPVLGRFPESCYDHNSDLCGFPLESCRVAPPVPAIFPPPITPQQGKKHKLPICIIILVAVAAALLPFLVLFVFLCFHKKLERKETEKEAEAGSGRAASAGWREKKLQQSPKDPERRVELEFFDRNIPVFDLDDLLRASAEVLGKGTHGTTYKANLESSGVVAVKRLNNKNGLITKKQFVQHLQLLGNLRHENLAHIISFYYSKEEKLIVYEFVPNGNLFDLLHENRGVGRIALNWRARLFIIKDIAKGLAFLHRSLPNQKVPHANLKTSNVLIHKDGESYHAKLTNYGFLTLLLSKKFSQTLAIARSPEFSQGRKLTHKTDVYCFGIIMLEIITGRIPDEEKSEHDLCAWVRSAVNSDWSTDILDVEILGSTEAHEQMLKLTEMALECTDLEPDNRPKITQLLTRIQDIDIKYTQTDYTVYGPPS